MQSSAQVSLSERPKLQCCCCAAMVRVRQRTAPLALAGGTGGQPGAAREGTMH